MGASSQQVMIASEAAGTVIESDRHRVLLVDEQAHVLRVMRLNLERCGYQVDTTSNADDALHKLKSHDYDALIMTSDLPDMTPLQLCTRAENQLHRVQAQVESPGRPLVLLGCRRDDDWPEEIAFVERLDQPVSLKRIMARLNEVFGAPGKQSPDCGNH